MSDKPTEFQAGELLRAIGTVRVPEPRVLENAREVLWSAVATEMLGIDPAGEQTQEQQRTTTRQRQSGQSRNERKMSTGREDPDS